MKLCVCAIVKDEEAYLIEWISYHLLIGVKHFYLYDNSEGSVLKRWIIQANMNRICTVIPFPGLAKQIEAYEEFRKEFAYAWEWVAFIDVDEYIHPLESTSLEAILDVPAEVSAIVINWLNFGPNVQKTEPGKLVIERFLRRYPTNAEVHGHVKSIVRCSHLVHCTENPHVFVTAGRQQQASGKPVNSTGFSYGSDHAYCVINHYFTKSIEEWGLKRKRGRATTNSQYTDDPLLDAIASATVFDGRILRFRKKTMAVMALFNQMR